MPRICRVRAREAPPRRRIRRDAAHEPMRIDTRAALPLPRTSQNGTEEARPVIEALTMPAILFGLAASTLTIAVANRLHRTLATTLDWIEDRVLRVRTARRQSAEAEALLREQLHERLQQDDTPPRTVINLTAGQWREVSKR